MGSALGEFQCPQADVDILPGQGGVRGNEAPHLVARNVIAIGVMSTVRGEILKSVVEELGQEE